MEDSLVVTYIAACLFLYFSHVIPSAPGVRGRLVVLLGAQTFRILYSVVSIAAVVWFVWAYSVSEMSGWVFTPLPGIIWAAVTLIPIAIFLMVARVGTPYGEIAKPAGARGIYRITRFPGSWGVLLWALVHLAATGDIKRVVAFGTFVLIAATALLKNEYVIRREPGAEARHFVEATGFFPLAAIYAGRQRLVGREIGWRIFLVSFLVTGLLLALHPLLFGVNPLHLIG